MQAEQQSERERFEAWATAKGIDLETHDSDGEYLWGPARDAWNAWQARAALSHPSTPQGWKLVPVELTPEMLSAMGEWDGTPDWLLEGLWKDALNAAPPPPEQGGRNA